MLKNLNGQSNRSDQDSALIFSIRQNQIANKTAEYHLWKAVGRIVDVPEFSLIFSVTPKKIKIDCFFNCGDFLNSETIF